MSKKRLRTTGDSPFNVRNERGSKQSCLTRIAELVGFGGIVAATVVAAAVGLVGCKPVSGTPHTSPTTATCDESQDCWNCRTMGNRQCGPGEVNQ